MPVGMVFWKAGLFSGLALEALAFGVVFGLAFGSIRSP